MYVHSVWFKEDCSIAAVQITEIGRRLKFVFLL